MNIRRLLIISLAATVAATPANAQSSFLDKLVNRVLQPAAVQTRSAGPVAQRPASTARATVEQIAATRRIIATPQSNLQLARDMTAAGPLIEKLANTGACGVDNTAWNGLNREALEPRTWTDLRSAVARGYDKYHDPRYCYDVVRITDFEKPAANALRFNVFYVSPQSRPRPSSGSSFRERRKASGW